MAPQLKIPDSVTTKTYLKQEIDDKLKTNDKKIIPILTNPQFDSHQNRETLLKLTTTNIYPNLKILIK